MDSVGAGWMIYKFPIFMQRMQTYIEKNMTFYLNLTLTISHHLTIV